MFIPRFYELLQQQITQDEYYTEQNRQRIRAHESILDLSHGRRYIFSPFPQGIREGVNAALVRIIVERNIAEPVICARNDLVVEPVMPEAPVNHIRKELRTLHKRIDDDSPVSFIHEPFVFHAREDETERLLERVGLTCLERIASVDKPGDEDGCECQRR